MKTPKAEPLERHKPPKAEFTLSQIVAIREALATVIDGGDPHGVGKMGDKEWLFYDSDNRRQIDRRMRFADAVQEILTRRVRTQIEKNERLAR